jgi:2-keto-4-pentenoate hydratase/2-oxohepta-3-ene-1,7-dioic acid hydratase in catechol pathway
VPTGKENALKLVTYARDGIEAVGAVQDEVVIDLSSIASTMLAFIERGPAALAAAIDLLGTAPETLPLASVRLLAPIPRPRRNVMCLGLNYADHARESYRAGGGDPQLPEVPIIFTKATTTVIGPGEPILFDPSASGQLDWEVELAFVIGRAGKNIPPAAAFDYVFGYTVLNDVSARDLQFQGKQFFKGKSLDGTCPTGPYLVTADEIADPHALDLHCRVNGVVKQASSTADMIFTIPEIVAYLSRGATLLPGDMVATGTPAGVGFARQPAEFLRPGDWVECAVQNVGTLRNPVVLAGGTA